jgi:hypothetical protein
MDTFQVLLLVGYKWENLQPRWQRHYLRNDLVFQPTDEEDWDFRNLGKNIFARPILMA